MNASEEMLRRAEDTANKLREQNKRLREKSDRMTYEGSWQQEIERLRAKLAEKDKRIAELESELKAAELKMYYPDEYGYAVVREADIDKAWVRFAKNKELRPYTRAGAECAMKELGIVACSKCGGTGEVLGWTGCEDWVNCPACHRNGVSHGWVW